MHEQISSRRDAFWFPHACSWTRNKLFYRKELKPALKLYHSPSRGRGAVLSVYFLGVSCHQCNELVGDGAMEG